MALAWIFEEGTDTGRRRRRANELRKPGHVGNETMLQLVRRPRPALVVRDRIRPGNVEVADASGSNEFQCSIRVLIRSGRNAAADHVEQPVCWLVFTDVCYPNDPPTCGGRAQRLLYETLTIEPDGNIICKTGDRAFAGL